MKTRCLGLRRLPAASIAAGACLLAPAAFPAPASLADHALEDITAGSVPAQPADGKLPVVIVADGASYTFTGEQSVHLAGQAQQGARALNVTAAAGSDVGNALNVLSQAADVVGDVQQQNRFRQTTGESGSLGRATLAGDNFTRSSLIESHASSASSLSTVTGHRDVSSTHSRTIDQFAVAIPGHSPFENLTLEVETPALAPVYIPAFGIDLLDDTETFGIEVGSGDFSLPVPHLVLGSVKLDGDDVVLSAGYVELDEFILPDVKGKLCFLVCEELDVDIDLGTFPAQRLDLPGDLRLAGANPFKDTQINLGQGVALVGAGSIVRQPGHITLTGELTLDLADPVLSFDFHIPSILEVGGESVIGPWDFDGPDVTIPIPAISISHTLIDEDVGFGYSAHFDGVLCLAVNDVDCGAASRTEQQRESRSDVLVYSASGESSASGGQSIQGQLDTHAGATLADAGADLIAMSWGTAQIESSNSITLENSAQRGLRAANAVNAADAIVGNALNVAAIQPRALAAASAGGMLSQSNAFTQLRTRYGQ